MEYVLASDFTPARGSKVRKGDEVEIWVMNGSKAAFGGLRIAYVKDGSASELVIPAESTCRWCPTQESADDSIITFSMPDLAADEGSALALSLHDAYYADGLAHDDDVKGNYLSDQSGFCGICRRLLRRQGRRVQRNRSPRPFRRQPFRLA